MKQPTKFVLYAVVDTTPGPEHNRVVAVTLTRQSARAELPHLAEINQYGPHEAHPFKVRRAKGVLFDT